jgi:Bacterial transcriptional activator domain
LLRHTPQARRPHKARDLVAPDAHDARAQLSIERRVHLAVSVTSADLLAAGDPERSALVLADALTLWRGRPLSELEGLGSRPDRGGAAD